MGVNDVSAMNIEEHGDTIPPESAVEVLGAVNNEIVPRAEVSHCQPEVRNHNEFV